VIQVFGFGGETRSRSQSFWSAVSVGLTVLAVVGLTIWALLDVVSLFVGLLAASASVLLLRYRSEFVLAFFVLGLLTIARTFSTYSLGPIPVSLILLIVLGFSFRHEIALHLRESRNGRWVLALWVLWSLWATVRLTLDTGTYGPLAARDALIAYSFSAYFLGAAVSIRYSPSQIVRGIRWMSLVASAYTWIYVFRAALPVSVMAGLDFSNVGVAGLALLALGLFGKGVWYRLVCLLSGFAAIVVSQGRTIYFAVPVVVLFYVLHRPRELSLGQWVFQCIKRIGLVLLVACGAVAFLNLLGSSASIEGRLGGFTVEDIYSQMTSVFSSSTVLSGSISDRDRWWTDIFNQMVSSGANAFGGLGLGSDLLHGFQAPDGTLVRKPHNDYLETAARFGIPSAVCLIAIVMVGAKPAIRAFRQGSEWAGLSAWWLAAAMTAFAQPYLAYPHGAMLMALVIGLFAKPKRRLFGDVSNAPADRSPMGRNDNVLAASGPGL
jgi:hypothetical protein